MPNTALPLWPHQERAVDVALSMIDGGVRRVCLTSPTGGGKTRIVQEIAQRLLNGGRRVALYTNRRMMIDQLSEGLMAAGMYHGVRAAGWDEEGDHPFQVCSMQTEASRVLKRGEKELHACRPGDLAIWDEAHLHTGEGATEIMRRHLEGGASVLGVTATPLGIGAHYDQLIQAGTMSELRACGALVPAWHYGCDEPDLKAFKRARKKEKVTEGQDLSERQQGEVMMVPGIMGRVWSWYCQLNPQHKPAVLFGPSVEHALWFAEQFENQGIAAAHVDSEDVWIRGKWYRADARAREAVRYGSKSGEIKVVTNRYVLREGIDWPWVEHLILCFIAGSVQTYLQVGGRGLRAYPGKERLVVQDHGGCWWRHGSLNEDRQWLLEYTPEIVYGMRANRLRQVPSKQPVVCPKCGLVISRRRCVCGYEFPPGKPSRPVVGTDGKVRQYTADAFTPRRVSTAPNGPALWERMYHRSRTVKGDRTFAEAAALFAAENWWVWPDTSWPLMPLDGDQGLDWHRHVVDVPSDRLVPKPKQHQPYEGVEL